MKKVSKIIALIILMALITTVFAACGKKDNNVADDIYQQDESNEAANQQADDHKDEGNEDSDQTSDDQEVASDVVIKVAALKGPTGMGMAKLMEDIQNGESELKADFTITGTPDELTGKIVSGEVNFACIPTNLAAVLYNKTGGKISLAGVNTLGVLYIMENGETIQSMADLKGKKIQASGQGSIPEYVLSYLLTKNNIEPGKDVEIAFGMQHAEVSATMISGDTTIALLPQPFVTTTKMKKEDARIALDLTEEWQKVQGEDSPLAMGCIVVNKAFAEKNTELVAAFLDAYKKSIDWVNENPVDAGVVIEKQGILPQAKVAELAIPDSHITYISGKDAEPMLNDLFQILFDFNPISIGGKLPGEDFYY
ncbi:ABC transporter substrate-binding protein [Vallitalea pronyensis]|nr:ABC transporter substrate-binding protein [Vallitalea pronyensis]